MTPYPTTFSTRIRSPSCGGRHACINSEHQSKHHNHMHDSQLATTGEQGQELGGQHKVSLQHIFLGHENIVEVMVPTPKPRPESCTGLGKTQKGALGKSDKAVGVELVESEKKQKIGSHCNDNVLETKSNSLSRSEQLQKRGNKQGPSVGRAVAAKVVNAPSTPKKNAPPLPTLQDSASGKSDDESLVDGNASANTKTDAATKKTTDVAADPTKRHRKAKRRISMAQNFLTSNHQHAQSLWGFSNLPSTMRLQAGESFHEQWERRQHEKRRASFLHKKFSRKKTARPRQCCYC